MIAEIAVCALAAWTVTYGLVFSDLLEGWRTRIGIGYDLDEEGFAIDRWAGNKLAELVNCPSCTGFWASLLIGLLWFSGLEIVVQFLAVAGTVLLVARWWGSQETKEEWWI